MATLGSKAVGSTVKIKLENKAWDFIVAHQGRPSADYVGFDGGTVLLMKDIYREYTWSNGSNDWENSPLEDYLNNAFYNYIDAKIRPYIKEVKIPYRPGSVAGSFVVNSGENGLTCKVFIPSAAEVNVYEWRGTWLSRDFHEGATWRYFADAGDSKRIARFSGSTNMWWLRTPDTRDTTGALLITKEGAIGYSTMYLTNSSEGVRPAFVLPNTLFVSDDGTVATNTAPSVPGAITLPGTINGGVAFTISWGASTDEQNNLGGYILERQLNGGSWTRIFQANLTSTTDTVPFGTALVIYRVKAYDAEGLESTYQTSQTKTVVNNTAPTTPGSITLPTTVIGDKSIVITWGASADAEGNLKQYELYRSIDGGSSWTLIYSGTALSHTDMITKGWPSVRYQVRAVDTQGAASGYTVSETRTVDNTVPPEITGGNSTVDDNGIAWSYTVTQADNEQTTVTEAIDGKTHRTYTAALGQQNTFSISGMDFMKLLNGSHTLSVTATSSGGKSVSGSVTVTKAVYEATMTLTNPLPADALITRMVMSVTGHIPPDAFFEVMVTNNANDPSPAWENATAAVKGAKKFFFTNTNAANGSAFNFRLTARRGSTGGYISLIGGAFE